MDRKSSDPPPRQFIQAGRDAIQAGGNFTSTKTTNFNFVFLIVGILALGGLAWGVYVGAIHSPQVTSPAPAQNR